MSARLDDRDLPSKQVACNKCTFGVLDTKNPHWLGTCECECHLDTYQLCPRCEGQEYDRGSCGLCQNSGILDQDGDAYLPPPGYDQGTPVEIVTRLNVLSRPRHRYS